MVTKNPKLTCPCCGKIRKLNATPLEEQEAWIRTNHWEAAEIIEAACSGVLQDWACDSCFKKGLAIQPDYQKQSYGMGGPKIAYFDEKYTCRNCHQEFLFKATEQKHWYEDLGFLLDSKPVNCIECRKNIRHKKNANEQLAIELNDLNKKDPVQLTKIAKLYKKINNEAKSMLFDRRAKNVLKKGDFTN